jgi:hypothetical protein
MMYVMAAASAVKAIGSIAQGRQQARQMESQAQAEEYNAAVNRQRAEQITASYGQREMAQRRQARMALGRQAAAGAQSGTGLGGSNADLLQQSTVAAELDSANIVYEGQLASTSELNEAQLSQFRASTYRSNAKFAKRSGYIGAVGDILGGTGQYMTATAKR